MEIVVHVNMLKEGWDVRNVTTIVGLRAYSSQSNILPEQTLGRGLRRMYRETGIGEQVSVVGTNAFMEFVESIKSEGVELEKKKMAAKDIGIARVTNCLTVKLPNSLNSNEAICCGTGCCSISLENFQFTILNFQSIYNNLIFKHLDFISN